MTLPQPLPGHALGSIDLDALLWSSMTPVLKVALMALVGAAAARKGLMGPNTREAVNALIFSIFTPSLIFYNVGVSVTPGHLVHWWPLVVNLLLNTGVGLLLGSLLSKYLRQTPQCFKRVVMAACSMGNNNNLPLVLTASIMGQAQGSLKEAFTAISPTTAMGYVAVVAAVSTMLRYSVGFHLMKAPTAAAYAPAASQPVAAATTDKNSQGSGDDSQQQQQVPKLLAKARLPMEGADEQETAEPGGEQIKAVMLPFETTSLQPLHHICAAAAGGAAADHRTGGTQAAAGIEAEHTPLLHSNTQLSSAAVYTAQGINMQQMQQHYTQRLAGPTSLEVDITAQPAVQTESTSGSHSVTTATFKGPAGLLQGLISAVQPLGTGLKKPPMLAFSAALFVVCIPPLQRSIFTPKAALSLIGSSAQTFSACAVPCMIMNLGAILEKGPGKTRLPWQVIAAISAVRLLILPILGMLWVIGGYFGELYTAPDPMFVLVMLVINTMPSGLNLAVLASVNHNAEAEIGCLLFWEYCAAFITLPLALTGYLLLAQAYFATPLVDVD
eukprot:GHUV01007310.1.p1 GENE.GHUV01007310.1~~GHUV01007310.1.p1  ORF type:complete len:555 (+),score=162.68 GHUV01007310.1:369-2033(+)